MVYRRVIHKKLGKLLVERNIINEEQLNQALELQKETGGLFGQILVSLGFATEEAITQALTAQYGFPYLPLRQYEIDDEVVKIVPENVARQYFLVPVDRVGDILTIAMADPLDVNAIEDIEMHSHCSVQVFVSTLSDVIEAISKYYDGNNHVQKEA